MARTIMPAFQKFPAEAQIISNLLAGYTDLELSLLNCVQVVRNDFDAVLKAMFRIRGESNRVNVADGLGLNRYRTLGLDVEFSDAIDAMRHCVKIRNQYAHCIYWDDYSGRLAIAYLEDAADLDQPVNNFDDMPVFHVDVPLLTAQEAYFCYKRSLVYGGSTTRDDVGPVRQQPPHHQRLQKFRNHRETFPSLDVIVGRLPPRLSRKGKIAQTAPAALQ